MPIGANRVSRNGNLGSAIPDSVAYQVQSEDFAIPWPFDVGGLNMSISGLSSDTFGNGVTSVFGDGTNSGSTSALNIGSQEKFGIAFTVEFPNPLSDFDSFFGFTQFSSSDSTFVARTDGGGTTGNIGFAIVDDGGRGLRLYTDSTFDDGNQYPVIINKNGNNANDIDIYVSDMASAESVTAVNNQAFDHTNYTPLDWEWYARNNKGSVASQTEMHAGIFEFNNKPYTQTERESFVSRRPEV